MNRRFLLRKRVLVPLGAGIGLLLLFWFVLLPWVVRGRVEAVLHQLQLRDVTFRVTRATPWTSTVRDIDAGDGNRIAELRVTYSAERLWYRRVDNIRIKGLQLTADVREGGASIKPLEAMMHEAAASSQPGAEPVVNDVAASASDWPFRSVRVEESMFVLRTPNGAMRLPFAATLRWPQLHAEVAGMMIDGAIGNPKATNIRFRGEGVQGDDLTAVLRALAPEAPVSVAGDVRINGGLERTGEETTFHADIVAEAAPEESAVAATKIAGTNVAVEQGVFHIAGTFSGADRSLKVTAKDVTLAESSVGAKAIGVSADLLFDNHPSATMKRLQVVRVERLRAAKVELTDGVVRFDLGADGTLNVHEARATFLGGEVSASDVRVAPDEPLAVTLRAENVELRELLRLLAPGKATGEGKVNGRLPLVFADSGVQLGEGAAEATAGGRLSVTDQATLESIAGSVAPADVKDPTRAPQAQVRQNIVAALKDFQYESLTARLRNEPNNGIVAYVRMVGKGRTGAQQALVYDLRVIGLDDLVRTLIGVHRTVTREAAKP